MQLGLTLRCGGWFGVRQRTKAELCWQRNASAQALSHEVETDTEVTQATLPMSIDGTAQVKSDGRGAPRG